MPQEQSSEGMTLTVDFSQKLLTPPTTSGVARTLAECINSSITVRPYHAEIVAGLLSNPFLPEEEYITVVRESLTQLFGRGHSPWQHTSNLSNFLIILNEGVTARYPESEQAQALLQLYAVVEAAVPFPETFQAAYQCEDTVLNDQWHHTATKSYHLSLVNRLLAAEASFTSLYQQMADSVEEGWAGLVQRLPYLGPVLLDLSIKNTIGSIEEDSSEQEVEEAAEKLAVLLDVRDKNVTAPTPCVRNRNEHYRRLVRLAERSPQVVTKYLSQAECLNNIWCCADATGSMPPAISQVVLEDILQNWEQLSNQEKKAVLRSGPLLPKELLQTLTFRVSSLYRDTSPWPSYRTPNVLYTWGAHLISYVEEVVGANPKITIKQLSEILTSVI